MALKDRLESMPVVGTAMAVQTRTKADAADQFAAAIGFFAFVSLIPLIAVVVAVAGFVLGNDPAAMERIVAGIQDSIPGLGSSAGLGSTIDSVVANAGSIGLIGGIVLLFTGLRITNAVQTATRFVFDLPLAEAKALHMRAWQLASLVILGTIALASVAVTSAASTLVNSTLGERFGIGATIATYVLGAVLDVGLFWVAYRIYTIGGELSWRDLLPGAILGGIGWSLLKSFGSYYAGRQAATISERTGGGGGGGGGAAAAGVVIASIIGLLLVFYLAGRLYVYGAELSAVLLGLPTSEAAVAEAATDVEEPATDPDRDGHARDETGPEPPTPPPSSLADRFRERGALVDDSVTVPTADGAGREVVPWQPPAGSRLDDRRTRQVVAFASSAVAVVTAGLLGRRRS